jgi:Transglycosylase SLT domain
LVGAAGVAVGLGALSVDSPGSIRGAAADVTAAPDSDAVDAAPDDREEQAAERESSRSVSRPALVSVQRATKKSAMPASRQEVSGAVTETVEATDPRDIALGMLGDYGWSTDEFSCLDSLYLQESGWNPAAENPSSGAYGIPQSLPGDKMAEYGSDWQTNPETQLEWGLAYIQDRYGSPCGAWNFWLSNNWY